MLWPDGTTTQPRVTSGFGPRPNVGAFAFHYGADMIGFSTVRAIAAGKVTFAGWLNNAAGTTVIIDHGGGVTSLYMHLATITVARGQMLGEGQALGVMGSSGNATGVCVHLEIRVHGTSVEPLAYVRARLPSTPSAPSQNGDPDMIVIRNKHTGHCFLLDTGRIKHIGNATDLAAAREVYPYRNVSDRAFRVALIGADVPYGKAVPGADWRR